jgi:hypothetical protein
VRVGCAPKLCRLREENDRAQEEPVCPQPLAGPYPQGGYLAARRWVVPTNRKPGHAKQSWQVAAIDRHDRRDELDEEQSPTQTDDDGGDQGRVHLHRPR